MMKDIILYPLVTEKSSNMQAQGNQYVFAVDLDANKFQIKQAVEALKKNVEVKSVRTQNVRGKLKRIGMYSGKRPNWKKAIVRLKEGQHLDLLESA